MDYKSVFTNLCLELQQNRSWIKGLGKNPQEWTHSLTAVPFVRGHRSVFHRTPRNTGVYTRHPTFVTATSGVLTRLLAKLSKNGMRVYTLSDRRSKKKLRVYTASEAKGLNVQHGAQVTVGFDILSKNLNINPAWCWILVDSERFLAKIAGVLGLKYQTCDFSGFFLISPFASKCSCWSRKERRCLHCVQISSFLFVGMWRVCKSSKD